MISLPPIYRVKKGSVFTLGKGGSSLFEALAELEAKGGLTLEQTIYIRTMGHTVIEAISRQLCHYAYFYWSNRAYYEND